MEFQNTSSGQPTCSSDTAQSGAVAAPVTPPVPPTDPLVESKWRRRWEQVHDVDGSLWEVREARATRHGFDLLFGYIANSHLGGRAKQGRSRLIATQALIDYWETHRTDTNTLYDLPAGRWALKELRRQLGFNFFNDRRDLWKTRIADLKSLTMHEFAERHNVDYQVAQDWRMRLVGPVLRSPYWWKAPAVLEILRGPLTKQEIAATFGLSLDQACRLRRRALAPDAPSRSDQDRLLPKRWRTAPVVETLRSALSHREVAKQLGISLPYAERLRKFLANEIRLAS